jgi:D-alanyl-D-alanine carboxypeptidase/D-alanyl-D-alanine-endopeptidase (penicillin-binding protein 4)
MSTLFAGLSAAFLALATLISGVAPASASSNLTALQTAVMDALRGSTASQVAVSAEVTGIGDVTHDPGLALRPASNEKLLVAETALQQLGPSYRYTTNVYGSSNIVGHVVRGDLILKASGDPLLSKADLTGISHELRRAGLLYVTGRVIVDDSRYTRRATAPGWQAGFVPDDLGPVDAFAVDEDAWRQDASYISDPAPANAGLWRQALTNSGIHSGGHTAIASVSTSSLPVLATYQSPPLQAIVKDMLVPSDNFLAEMLLDELGAVRSGHGDRTPGIAVIVAEAHQLGARLGAVYDGSGLSYDDAESPNSLVGWLQLSMHTSTGPLLRTSLPVSCESGTLQHRLCGPYLTGRIEAKTGTLTSVSTLSGYTTTRSGRPVTFSIMMSGINDWQTALDHMDGAVAVLARWNS